MRCVFVISVVLGCLSSSVVATSATSTGIDAIVIRRPPEITCIRAPCWAPVAGVPVSFVRDGKVVRRIKTGRDGHAVATLAPGTYAVRAPGVPLPLGKSRRLVRVVAGHVTKVTLPIGAKPSGGGQGPVNP